MESAQFVALPDIQPLVSGHTLIVTRHHIGSFSEVPRVLYEELRGFVRGVKMLITDRYAQRPFVFEHGPGAGTYSGCCISHAHLHVIPLDAPVAGWLEAEIDGELRAGRGDVAATLSSVGSSYLYFQNADNEDFLVSDLESAVPRQFLRRAVGRFLNLPDWNWQSGLSLAYAREQSNGV